MSSRIKARTTKAINHGRPPLLKPQAAALSSTATRSIIRSHHNLHRQLAKAVEQGDTAKAGDIENLLNHYASLEKYQTASTLGQSNARGGDSSKVLVGWLREGLDVAQFENGRLRMLEIGALSTRNACSRADFLGVTRIDLHSREPGIQEIDFMDLPIPPSEAQKYHVISLSLVLNFVPDAAARGQMLQRIPRFLPTEPYETASPVLPCLFLVLPLACVSNSRYLTEGKLEELMKTLGFSPIKVKRTAKLYYSLWNHRQGEATGNKEMKKEELRSGASRNNFAITMR